MGQQKRKPLAGSDNKASSAKRTKAKKQPTQHPPMERIAILGKNGKIRWEWRPWW